MWAGSHHLDVTNNSYFADPWLFNCRNDAEQRTIWKAEQRAIRYAISQGVTVVAGQGNQNMDLPERRQHQPRHEPYAADAGSNQRVRGDPSRNSGCDRRDRGR